MYDKHLREKQEIAYALFAKLWKEREMDKARAYQWLSEKLKRSKGRLNFYDFNYTVCNKVIELMENVLKDN